MAKVIAICNQKGGVGKTTTAVNLSAAIAAAERKTLLIDLDAQGNATTGLGFDKRNVEPSIYNALIDGLDITSVLRPTDLKYLKVAPANSSLVGAEVEMVGIVSREIRLRHLLSAIHDDFDYILIDCPPSLGLLTLNALSAADGVLIPVQCEYYALEGIADLQRTISLVKDRVNPDLGILGIVLTMFDSRNNISHQVADNVRKHFGDLVFDVVIPRNVRLSEAPSFGKPVLLYDVNSKGAASYFSLAKEVIMSENPKSLINDENMVDFHQNSIK